MWIQCMGPLRQLVNLTMCKQVGIRRMEDGYYYVHADDAIISKHSDVNEAATVRDAIAAAVGARSYEEFFRPLPKEPGE